jgi:ATP-dependent DNA helicase RecG
MGVRFLPSGYIAPHRVALELTARQREICHILAGGELPLRNIMARLTDPSAEATVSADLYRLKHLEVINSRGHGRGAVWFLVHRSIK